MPSVSRGTDLGDRRKKGLSGAGLREEPDGAAAPEWDTKKAAPIAATMRPMKDKRFKSRKSQVYEYKRETARKSTGGITHSNGP